MVVRASPSRAVDDRGFTRIVGERNKTGRRRSGYIDVEVGVSYAAKIDRRAGRDGVSRFLARPPRGRNRPGIRVVTRRNDVKGAGIAKRNEKSKRSKRKKARS